VVASEYGPSTYGDRIAGRYDDFYADLDPTVAARTLAVLAKRRRVLELGIGTGRIALPLVELGVEVHGMDASEEMVALLGKKPGGDGIPVTIGDFADVEVEGRFGLVFIAFNTFFGLLTAEDQARCFRNVARRLEPGGGFLIEAFVPDLARFDRDQRVSATRVLDFEVHLEVSKHDPASQRVDTQLVVVSLENGVSMYPIRIRYAWPEELDAMATEAGLLLRERWSGWDRSPFSEDSAFHLSMWERPAGSAS